MKRATAALALILLGACATTGDIRRLENEIAQVRDVQTRRDAERARQVAEVMRLQQQMLDSLANTRQAMRALRGDVQNDLYGIQQQLESRQALLAVNHCPLLQVARRILQLLEHDRAQKVR